MLAYANPSVNRIYKNFSKSYLGEKITIQAVLVLILIVGGILIKSIKNPKHDYAPGK